MHNHNVRNHIVKCKLEGTLMPGGALDPKLGRHVRQTEKITGPLLVQSLREILGKLTVISANLSSN